MKKKIAKGFVWLVSAKLIVNALGLVSTLVFARLLTPEDFGLVALATTMLTVIGSFTELSMSSALIHHPGPTEAHFQTAWTLNVVRAAIVSLLFCSAAPIAAALYHEPRMTGIMLALGASVMIAGFYNPKTVLLTRELVFWQEFALTVSQKLAAFVIGLAIALVYKSYWALVAAIVAAQLVSTVLSYPIIAFRPKFSLTHARGLWSFSVWLSLGQIVNTLNWKLDHLLVGTYLGRSALGYYSVGDNLAGMATRETIGPLETMLFPGFAQISGDIPRLRQVYRSAQSLISAVALPAGVGTALIARPLVLLTIGAKWLPAVEIIQVLACVFAFQTLCSPVHPLAMARGETRLLFRRDLASFGIRVPIILLGMYLGGVVGIIYARAAASVISTTINLHLVSHMIGTPVAAQLQANARSVASSVVMAAVVLALQHQLGQATDRSVLLLQIGVCVLLAALTYTSFHLALWRLARKPNGPEAEILRVIAQVGRRLKFARPS